VLPKTTNLSGSGLAFQKESKIATAVSISSQLASQEVRVFPSKDGPDLASRRDQRITIDQTCHVLNFKPKVLIPTQVGQNLQSCSGRFWRPSITSIERI